MIRHLIAILFFSGVPFASGVVDSEVRASIGTEDEIWTGQKVILVVELVAPGYFAGSPSFDLPKLSGCLIVPPAGSPVVGSETRDGQSFTVQRHELLVFPRRPGKFDIPPFGIRFAIKRAPLDQESVAQSVRTQPLSINVTAPPGDAAKVSLTSTDLKVSESWTPEPGKRAKPGDAFVRTITWSASDMTGMAFPPFPRDKIPGLGIYRKDPLVEDTSDRGNLQGKRVDTITYICKAGGDFSIPAYKIRWWDPGKKSLQTTEFPIRAFTVVVPPPPPEPFSRKASRYLRSHGIGIAAIAAAFTIFAGTFRFWSPPVISFFHRLRPRHLPPLNPLPPA